MKRHDFVRSLSSSKLFLVLLNYQDLRGHFDIYWLGFSHPSEIV